MKNGKYPTYMPFAKPDTVRQAMRNGMEIQRRSYAIFTLSATSRASKSRRTAPCHLPGQRLPLPRPLPS